MKRDVLAGTAATLPLLFLALLFLMAGNAQAVTDGGFEAGTPNPHWTEASTNFGTPICSSPPCSSAVGSGPRTGDYWAWFGGIGGVEEQGSVEQAVTGGALEICTLSFFLEIPTSSGNGADFLRVLLGGQEVFKVLESGPGFGTYAEVTVDVSDAIDGSAQLLRFESTTTGTGSVNSNFFVDDISLRCQPIPTSPPAGIFAGRGDLAGVVTDPVYSVDELSGSSQALFSGLPVLGAAYVPGTAVYFTTSTVDSNDTDGSTLMRWDGGDPTPDCTLTVAGEDLRVDGLGYDPVDGILYMMHEFDSAMNPAGVYGGPSCDTLAPIVLLPNTDIGGIAFDPDTMTLFGTDDASWQIVAIDLSTGALTPVADYPAGVVDMDGLAYNGGTLYLIPDDAPGVILVFDLTSGTYQAPLPLPWSGPGVFSAGTFVPGGIFADSFESGDTSAWSSSQ